MPSPLRSASTTFTDPMHVYHFSDRDGIEEFVPRALVQDRPPGQEWLNEPLVWAIDAWHAPLYYFPRDCPRIVAWPTADTTPADRALWFGDRDAHMLAHIEWTWLEPLRTAALYRYTFDAGPFRALPGPHMSPGTWVSAAAVRPIATEPVGPLLDALRDANVELRVMPSLAPLRNAWDSTLHVSGVRLRNARDWPS